MIKGVRDCLFIVFIDLLGVVIGNKEFLVFGQGDFKSTYRLRTCSVKSSW